jgi:hypothetical protein
MWKLTSFTEIQKYCLDIFMLYSITKIHLYVSVLKLKLYVKTNNVQRLLSSGMCSVQSCRSLLTFQKKVLSVMLVTCLNYSLTLEDGEGTFL